VKILLLGDGAREHAIGHGLRKSLTTPELYCLGAHRNPGLLRLAKEFATGNVEDPKDVLECAIKFGADYVVAGPEAVNFAGVPDALEREGIPCFGAKKCLAEIERSKVLLRRIMQKEGIPGRIRYLAFKNKDEAEAYAKLNPENIVFKPPGQVGGKGVRLVEGDKVYLTSATEGIKKSAAETAEKFGNPLGLEEKVLIEERIFGPEFTAHFFCDGNTFVATPLVQDNKHAFDGMEGPETGGMGSVAGPGMHLPFITDEDTQKTREIVEKTIRAIQKVASEKYRGVVAGQMILGTGYWDVPLEFYSRFGDPEGVNVINMLNIEEGASLEEIFSATISGKLNTLKIKFRPVASVVKAFAPDGYPLSKELAQNHPLVVDEAKILKKGCSVFYGSVDSQNGQMITKGSRGLEIYAEAENLPEASSSIEAVASCISLSDGWRVFHRSDIGTEQLLKQWMEIAEDAREASRRREAKGLLYKRVDFIPGRGKIEYEI